MDLIVDTTTLSNFALINRLDILDLMEEDNVFFHRLKETFGKGEASCLAVCMNQSFKILTDDLDARKFAQRTGIPVSGTIGVLVSAVRTEIISKNEAEDILSEMIDRGFYSPIKSLDEMEKDR